MYPKHLPEVYYQESEPSDSSVDLTPLNSRLQNLESRTFYVPSDRYRIAQAEQEIENLKARIAQLESQ